MRCIPLLAPVLHCGGAFLSWPQSSSPSRSGGGAFPDDPLLKDGDDRCVARQLGEMPSTPLIEMFEQFLGHPERQVHMLLPTTRLIAGQWLTPCGAPADKV